MESNTLIFAVLKARFMSPLHYVLNCEVFCIDIQQVSTTIVTAIPLFYCTTVIMEEVGCVRRGRMLLPISAVETGQCRSTRSLRATYADAAI